MNPVFQKSFEKLQDQQKQLLDTIKDLPEDVYTHAPAGKWSIAQIVTHLLASEKLSIAYMRKKSLGIERLNDSGLKHAIMLGVLKISQRIPFRYKAPRVIVENTPAAFSKVDAIRQWNDVRVDLKKFLESIAQQHTKRLIFKHPIAGMLNAKQAMDFMHEHINHHLPQIKRLLNR